MSTDNLAQIPTVDNILSKLSPSVFEKSSRKATRTLAVSIGLLALSVYLIANVHWLLLPLCWLFAGTVATGLFAVSYSCNQQQFFKRPLLNDVVGAICMTPLLYSFESWKLQDNSLYKQLASFVSGPFWFLSSLWEWVNVNVNFKKNTGVVVNVIVLYVFAALFFPLMIYFLGVWGLFKFYVIPLCVAHFWRSSFFKVNGTLAKEATTAQDAKAIIINCKYPRWLELLTHHSNYAIQVDLTEPKATAASETAIQHYDKLVTTVQEALAKVPAYNLRRAKDELVASFEKNVKNYSLPKLLTKSDKKVNWPTTLFIFLTPIIALYGILTTRFVLGTWIVSIVTYFIGGVGISAGYHRLYSHRSYDAHRIVSIILVLLGTSTFEMSCLDWCEDHRAHHRYTDTERDPYNIKQGFWHAHMGWLIYERDEEAKKRFKSDISDLLKDDFLVFQHKYYLPLAFLTGFIIPMAICGLLFDDWRGGFFIGAVASKVMIMQCTFFINSLAHYAGNATFTDTRTPRDSYLVSLVTFGEGYHNFHHEFPYDYRNGLHIYDFDPPKWLIAFLSWFGLTYNLKRFPDDVFLKGKLKMRQKQLDEEKAKLNWGLTDEELAKNRYTAARMKHESDNGKKLMVVDGKVYDVTGFGDKHPGGRNFIDAFVGRDVTKQFNGSVYKHSDAARHILDTLAIGVFDDTNAAIEATDDEAIAAEQQQIQQRQQQFAIQYTKKHQ